FYFIAQPTTALSPLSLHAALPISASSDRWETADRRYLEAAFEAAGVDYDIQNAQGSREDFQTIAEQMLTSGVNVLMTVNLDSGTDRKSTRLNSSHVKISYAVFCLK